VHKTRTCAHAHTHKHTHTHTHTHTHSIGCYTQATQYFPQHTTTTHLSLLTTLSQHILSHPTRFIPRNTAPQNTPLPPPDASSQSPTSAGIPSLAAGHVPSPTPLHICIHKRANHVQCKVPEHYVQGSSTQRRRAPSPTPPRNCTQRSDSHSI
jgi:hypothetical protein